MEWLGMISPIVDVLRHLSRNFHSALGAELGAKHAPADLSKDIKTLMESLDEHSVYQVEKGRVVEDIDGGAVGDAVTEGFNSLVEGGPKAPLAEYNAAFARIQERRKIPPITTETVKQTSNDILVAEAHSPPSRTPLTSQSTTIENDNEPEEEPRTELENILEDLENGVVDPTLPCLTEADVALDMDAAEEFVEYIDESSESEDFESSEDDEIY